VPAFNVRNPPWLKTIGSAIRAKFLWGEQSVKELDQLAMYLANECGISPIALEDALCTWQKQLSRASKSKSKQVPAAFDLFQV
jgi:hypothetical protein